MDGSKQVYIVEYGNTNQGWMGIAEDGHSLSHNILKAKHFGTYMDAMEWKGTMDSEHFHDYRVQGYIITWTKD